MVKYGSTVRIAVLPRDSNEPLYELPITLADTFAAHDTMKKSADKVRDWLYREATFVKKYSDITDDQILELARSRGIAIVPKTNFAELFYFVSRSGLTKGHYIEWYPLEIVCTCPGFKNRGYCWATNKVKSGTAIDHKWVASRETFYANRKLAYGE